jgi:hypothetical protein
MSLQTVNLTTIVVYFVGFKMFGAAFDTVDRVYNQVLGEIRFCALSYLNL